MQGGSSVTREPYALDAERYRLAPLRRILPTARGLRRFRRFRRDPRQPSRAGAARLVAENVILRLSELGDDDCEGAVAAGRMIGVLYW
jgi:hypothetical protein